MPLGDSNLRSERTRSRGDLLLDDAEAAHAYAWLCKHGPATVADYEETVGVNDRQATLAVNRLHAHGLVSETEDGYLAEPVHEQVGDVHVTAGVAAVLARQLENYNAREFVQKHGTRTLAKAVTYWPLVRDDTIDSRAVGRHLGIGEADGVTATNFVRRVSEYFEYDPYFEALPTPDVE